MLKDAPLKEKLREICRILEAQISGAHCSVMLVNDAKTHLKLAVAGSLPNEFITELKNFPITEGNGACGDAVVKGRDVIVPDMRKDARFAAYLDLIERFKLRACWSSPCFSPSNEVLGTFALYFKRCRKPTKPELYLLEQARDLVTLMLAREQEQSDLKLLKRSVEASSNGIVVADASQPWRPLIYVNPAFEKMTGYQSSELLGKSCAILQGKDSSMQSVRYIRERLSLQQEAQTEIRNYRKDGTPFWNDLYIAPVRDHEGKVTHFIGIQNDITARKEQEAKISWHATHDTLTGLPNRVLLEDRLQQAFRQCKRLKHPLAVMFIDLDGFKPINDTLGHNVGDELLKAVALRIQTAIRAGDTLARFGGDEFALILPNAGIPADINEIAKRLLVAISEPYLLNQNEISVTASIGIAITDSKASDPNKLIQQADIAMYKAKRQGSNNYEWFGHDMGEKLERRVRLRHDMQNALMNSEFFLEYQPIFNHDRNVIGAEALVRWEHPKLGRMSPAEFIALAEQTGQIIPLGKWVFEQVCRDYPRLATLGMTSVSVNVSPVQLSRANFFEDFRAALARYDVKASNLILEITENVFIDDFTNAIPVLYQFHQAGFKIALDDFGTGYSSLRFVHELPLDIIKIDRSFIQDAGTGSRQESIIRAICAIAEEMSLKTVAEGVEEEVQVQFLETVGCTYYQGYLLARPQTLNILEETYLPSTAK
nr:EAL domain-containing protein [Aliidiomarina indica]